jgi:hypothetical protein
MNRSLHAGSGETGIRLVAVYGEVPPPPGDECGLERTALRAKGLEAFRSRSCRVITDT